MFFCLFSLFYNVDTQKISMEIFFPIIYILYLYVKYTCTLRLNFQQIKTQRLYNGVHVLIWALSIKYTCIKVTSVYITCMCLLNLAVSFIGDGNRTATYSVFTAIHLPKAQDKWNLIRTSENCERICLNKF